MSCVGLGIDALSTADLIGLVALKPAGAVGAELASRARYIASSAVGCAGFDIDALAVAELFIFAGAGAFIFFAADLAAGALVIARATMVDAGGNDAILAAADLALGAGLLAGIGVRVGIGVGIAGARVGICICRVGVGGGISVGIIRGSRGALVDAKSLDAARSCQAIGIVIAGNFAEAPLVDATGEGEDEDGDKFYKKGELEAAREGGHRRAQIQRE